MLKKPKCFKKLAVATKIMVIKIIHEREICIGCGACAMVCPKHWVMNSDGKADLKKGDDKNKMAHIGGNDDVYELELNDKDIDNNDEAEKSCPVLCIHVKKE